MSTWARGMGTAAHGPAVGADHAVAGLHDVRPADPRRVEQRLDTAGAHEIVRVQEKDPGRAALGETAVSRRGRPAVFLMHDREPLTCARVEDLPRAVGGAVVHGDDAEAIRGLLREHGVQTGVQPALRVVDRDDHVHVEAAVGGGQGRVEQGRAPRIGMQAGEQGLRLRRRRQRGAVLCQRGEQAARRVAETQLLMAFEAKLIGLSHLPTQSLSCCGSTPRRRGRRSCAPAPRRR